MSEYNVGDLVKDHFDRIYVVKTTKFNKDGFLYGLDLLQVSGKLRKPYELVDGTYHCFPTDVAPLKTQGVNDA